EEMAEVLAVRLKATDVDDVHVRELVGDYLRGIHEAEGSRKDGVEAFTGQRADHLFGVSALGHVLDVGCMHPFHRLLHAETAYIVRLAPPAVVMRANVHERDVMHALLNS